MIQDLEKTKTVFKEQGVDVWAAAFCLGDERFAYLEWPYSIHILNKYYSRITVLKFSHPLDTIVVSEDGHNILVSDSKSVWGCVNLGTLKKEFEKKSRKEIKEWASYQHDSKCLVYSSLPTIDN